MVKTTIVLEDELYKKLVQEALEKYGTTRKLSFLINQKLKEKESTKLEVKGKRITIRLGKKLGQKEVEKLIEKGLEEATKWRQ